MLTYSSSQLDASLVDLAPSAYDIVASSLPPPNPASHGWKASGSEKLAQLPSPSTAKAAWRNSFQGSTSSAISSTAAQRKQPQRGPVHPNESFVLLQDSVIRTIPSNLPTTSPPHPKKPSFSKSRSATAAVPPAPAPEEPPHPNPSPLSHHLRSSLRLFNLLSSRTDLDHPLCAECTHILLGTLTRQLEETKKERDGYIAFEKEVRKEKEREASTGASKSEAEAKIERLKDEERLAIEQLKAAERERQQLEEELKGLEREEKALEDEEAECVSRLAVVHGRANVCLFDRFWRQHNAHLLKSAEQASQLAALRAAYAADSAVLDKLEKTNVYNDAFCIGHDGVFGTINGLRLGRVPGVPVSDTLLRAAEKCSTHSLSRSNGLRSMRLGARRYCCYIQLHANSTSPSRSTCMRASHSEFADSYDHMQLSPGTHGVLLSDREDDG